MSSTYLHDCLDQFPEISRQRWGHLLDMQNIETKLKAIRSANINVRDIHTHFSSIFRETKHSWLRQYWLFPSLADLSREEQEQTFNFHQLSKGNEGKPKEEKAIQSLLKAFRQIELVSIILRFICPVSFGILSPPVEYVLALRRGKTAVETYRHYLHDLRKIGKEYGFDSVAKVDMALWVLKHKCYDKHYEDERIKHHFETDTFMLRLRADNLVKPLSDLSPAWLATALHTAKDDLAVLAGSFAFEKNVKNLAGDRKTRKEVEELAKKDTSNFKEPKLRHFLKALKNTDKITPMEYSQWERLRKIRNKAFHAVDENISQHDIRKLIDTAVEIEQRLNNRSKQ